MIRTNYKLTCREMAERRRRLMRSWSLRWRANKNEKALKAAINWRDSALWWEKEVE